MSNISLIKVSISSFLAALKFSLFKLHILMVSSLLQVLFGSVMLNLQSSAFTNWRFAICTLFINWTLRLVVCLYKLTFSGDIFWPKHSANIMLHLFSKFTFGASQREAPLLFDIVSCVGHLSFQWHAFLRASPRRHVIGMADDLHCWVLFVTFCKL